MARRRKSKESPIEMLFKAPWWVSMIVAIVVLITMKWIAPAFVSSNVILKPLATLMSNMAWLFSGVFFFVGLLSFAREKFSTSKPLALPAWNRNEPSAKMKAASGWQAKVEQYGAQGQSVGGNERAVEASVASTAGDAPKAKPTEWNVDLLRDLEWKRYEDVCQQFYTMKSIKSETTPLGPDGGIDIRLYQGGSDKPTSIVQCKAWGVRNVGIKPVRELLGVMAHEKIEKAFFMASGSFTEEAKAFAQSNRITLINGDMLVTMIKRLSEAEQQTLLLFATQGDFSTPTCSSCGIKMRCVPGTSGRPDFWGCQNYPRCRQRLGMRAPGKH